MTAWLNLLWMLVVVATFSWFLANLLVLGFTPLIKSSSVVGERKHLLFLAALPWVFPVTATASLILLSLAKSQGWIHHHCLSHQPHHPHFCLEHLPDIALGLTHSMAGITAVSGLLTAFFWRMARHYRLFAQSRLLRRLVRGRFLRRTLADVHPFAFTVGIRKPFVFISKDLDQLLSKRQRRIVIEHEVAHIRNRDVLKNTAFEVLLGIHIFPQRLRLRWYLTSEILADERVSKHFDALEIAEVLVRLKRAGANSPFPAAISGGVITTRIGRLLNRDADKTYARPAIFFFYLTVVAFPVALMASHHVLETLWGWML